MAREFMPKSGALMPYVVVNRDAAVAGVFTVDGEGGSVDLTGKYVQITDYNQRVGSLETEVTTNTGDITNLKTAVTSINGSIGTINTSLSNKAAKGVNSDITSLSGLTTPLSIAQGGTGGTNPSIARNNLEIITQTTGAKVFKIGSLVYQSWLAQGAAIGTFNPQVIGGTTYYTHYFKFTLPVALTTGISDACATLVGSNFGGQVSEVPATVRVRRDNDAGTAQSTTTLTVAITTPTTGWIPYLHIILTGV